MKPILTVPDPGAITVAIEFSMTLDQWLEVRRDLMADRESYASVFIHEMQEAVEGFTRAMVQYGFSIPDEPREPNF